MPLLPSVETGFGASQASCLPLYWRLRFLTVRTRPLVWNFKDSILKGPENQTKYWIELHDAVNSKKDAGFDVSITDY
jgi:hypothetical protein